MADATDGYARDAGTPWADLDAAVIAVGVQDMTGNYFTTMECLGDGVPDLERVLKIIFC